MCGEEGLGASVGGGGHRLSRCCEGGVRSGGRGRCRVGAVSAAGKAGALWGIALRLLVGREADVFLQTLAGQICRF